jgi:hypothetical protein
MHILVTPASTSKEIIQVATYACANSTSHCYTILVALTTSQQKGSSQDGCTVPEASLLGHDLSVTTLTTANDFAAMLDDYFNYSGLTH